jgi:hypothetical protein
MPKYLDPKLRRQQMIVIVRCGGFTETKVTRSLPFALCRNFRIPGVSIFRNL